MIDETKLNKYAKEPFAWSIESINVKGKKIIWWALLWGDGENGNIVTFDAKDKSLDSAINKVIEKYEQWKGKK